MQRLAVVYDDGAVRPIEIFTALRHLAKLVFVPTPSQHAIEQIPVMQACGEVVRTDQGGGSADVAARLRRAAPEGIVTYSERCLPMASELALALQLPHYSPEVLENLTNKVLQRERLRGSGVDPTASTEVSAADELVAAVRRLGGRVVVKPSRLGGGSRHTYRIDGEDEGRILASTLFGRQGTVRESSYVVEELLVGTPVEGIADYVSVESVVTAAGVRHLALTGKLPLAAPFRETGQFWPADLAPAVASSVRELVSAAIRTLGVDRGVLHTEVKLTEDGPRIIEVNGRLGGHIEELCNRTGAESAVLIAAKVALGMEVDVGEVAPDEVYWQHNAPAPRTPCTFREVAGIEEVLATERISRYRPYVSPGQALEGGVQTRMIDILCGESPSHAEMLEDVTRARSKLTFSFDFPDGPREVPADALEAL